MNLPVREPTEQRIQRTLTIIAAFFATVWLIVLVVVLVAYKLDPMPLSILVKGILMFCLGVVAMLTSWVSVWAHMPATRSTEKHTEVGVEDVPVVSFTPVRRPRLAIVTSGVASATALILSPLLTSTTAQLGPEHAKLVTFSQFGSVLIAVTGVILTSAIARDRWRWTYVALATLGRVPWAFAALNNDPSSVRHSMAMGAIAMGFVVAEVHYLRTVAGNGDRVLREATDDVVDTAARTSATAEAARIDGLVHDHILAALLLASRADDPEDAPYIRRAAAWALAALSEITAPEADESDVKEMSVAAFAAHLIHDVRAEDSNIITTGRGTRPDPIPTEVASTLLAAAMEAVRNSLRHAAGDSGRTVTRRVTVNTTWDTVSVIVADDGVGFDQAVATTGRYGVAGSILGRMENLKGGSAEIHSAPGNGTVVRLSWSDPDAKPSRGKQPAGEKTKFSGHGTIEEQYFAQLEESAMDEVPLGPTYRAMVTVMGGFLYLIIGTLGYFDPVWASPVSAVIFILGFVLSILPWLSDPLADPGNGATAIMVTLGPAVLALTLWAWDSDRPVHTNLWTVMVMYLVIILLGFSNYPRAAWVAGLASVAVLVAWAALSRDPSRAAPEMVVFFLILPWMVNRIQNITFSMMAKSAALAGRQRQEADVRARELASTAARRKRGQRIDGLARPLLERLAAGERTDAPVRTEAAQLEAHLRDDLRARCFRSTDVTRAANEARRAGIRVDLLDDGGLNNAPAQLRNEVIEAALEALESAHEGSVIVRVAPPGRDVVATILTETGSGADAKTHRLEIHTPRVVAGAS